MYANKNMAGTWIVCPIYMINLPGDARTDLVAKCLGRRTLEPASIPAWAPILHYFLLFFQLCNNELLPTSNMN